MTVTIADAQTRLRELIREATSGERVVLVGDDGCPVAELTLPVTERELREKILVNIFGAYDPDDHRTPEELEADAASEIEERLALAEREPTFTLDEVWERSQRYVAELRSQLEQVETSQK
jgi:antitoxin (DNA-binding transcriptional repressor) of toxin-antitoxin stability system